MKENSNLPRIVIELKWLSVTFPLFHFIRMWKSSCRCQNMLNIRNLIKQETYFIFLYDFFLAKYTKENIFLMTLQSFNSGRNTYKSNCPSS